jgi:hypothetical protein
VVAVPASGGILAAAPGDHDSLVLWCQVQERLAGLERVAGDFPAAAARLDAVLEAATPRPGSRWRGGVSRCAPPHSVKITPTWPAT